MAQKPWFVPIPGTTKLHRLKENLAAAAIAFTAAELAEIKSKLDAIPVVGGRYSEASEKMIDR